MQDIPTVYAIVIILGGILPLAVVGCIMAAVALATRPAGAGAFR